MHRSRWEPSRLVLKRTYGAKDDDDLAQLEPDADLDKKLSEVEKESSVFVHPFKHIDAYIITDIQINTISFVHLNAFIYLHAHEYEFHYKRPLCKI